jgi:hypothetical protein
MGIKARLAFETGSLDEAAEIASAGLDRRDVWARPHSVHDDPSTLFAAIAMRAGRMTRAQAKSVVDSFVEEWTAAPEAIVRILARAPFALLGDPIEPAPDDLPQPMPPTARSRHIFLAVNAQAVVLWHVPLMTLPLIVPVHDPLAPVAVTPA